MAEACRLEALEAKPCVPARGKAGSRRSSCWKRRIEETATSYSEKTLHASQERGLAQALDPAVRLHGSWIAHGSRRLANQGARNFAPLLQSSTLIGQKPRKPPHICNLCGAESGTYPAGKKAVWVVASRRQKHSATKSLMVATPPVTPSPAAVAALLHVAASQAQTGRREVGETQVAIGLAKNFFCRKCAGPRICSIA